MFVVYGVGMALVLLAVTVAIALGRRTLVRWLRRSGRYVNRVAGVVLILAGAYIVWFWTTNLNRGPLRTSDPVAFVEGLSSQVTELIGGAPLVTGLVAGGIVAAAGVYLWAHARARPSSDPDGEPSVS